jgi:hypothetical protein
MRYDAFISYRHGELDGIVAEKLHRMLESYRVPRAIAQKTGKKKLARVFRDREELPTSSNLSDSINEALESSEFLLLVCSRRTCASQWVMREVERFGELRGKDRIITLLIDGEPDESFPPGLREREVGGETVFVEPLAADVRAETPAQSIKLLKEEKLRLLAPILGCAFDDLRRRHRRRRLRRAAAVVGFTFALTVSFGSFSTWQYLRIDREMQLKLENQSYVLAEYAGTALADGDPDTAMLLALAALPEDPDKPGRPLVAAAERALSDALMVYDPSSGYKPHKSPALPASPGRAALSPDGSYIAAVYPFSLALFDTESGELTASLPTVPSASADAEFLSESVVVFAGADGITAYDIEGGGELWRGRPATELAVSSDGSVIAAVYKDAGTAVLYAPDGVEIAEISFGGKAVRVPPDDSFIAPRDALFALSGDGGRLAVSFADGSLSVFDTAAGTAAEVYPPSRAVHFAGGFCGDMLAFSVVEREPYASAFLVINAATGERAARYESDSSHFVPLADEAGIYVAFEEQVMEVDARTDEVSHAASAGGSVETFAKNGNILLICEQSGAYRIADISTGETRSFASGYAGHFADAAGAFAVTGSRDSKTLRVLKARESFGTLLFAYDRAYSFSEAKIDPAANRAAFYSYRGLRLYDLAGNIVAETTFPDPESVSDTQYDSESGNIAVLYENALRLYLGVDGSLLLDARGKPGARSVLYTPFGVSVLSENGDVTLYSLADGQALAEAHASPGADFALPFPGGGLAMAEGGRVFFDGRELGAGKFIGAGKTEDGFALAVSDSVSGRVFFVKDGAITEGFSFEARGASEAYFAGGYAFISPANGDAAAYAADGAIVRNFTESGYMADVSALGERVAANYVSASGERYSFLLAPGTLETEAYLPGFLGELDSDTLVLDDGGGSLRAVRLLDTRELMDTARERLDGRELTPNEKIKYKAG